MLIEKSPKFSPELFRVNNRFYPRARDAFADILRVHKRTGLERIVLPDYIGWGDWDGSGVFDPIESEANDCQIDFYNIDTNINIDFESYHKCLIKSKKKTLVLIIHYFGFTDPFLLKLIETARHYEAVIVEDCAHAFFTDFATYNGCGKLGDYSVYSLHKQFPFNYGGMLKINTKTNNEFGGLTQPPPDINPWNYNWIEISKQRRKNAEMILKYVKDIKGIYPIYPQIDDKTVPQTFPIFIQGDFRDRVHELMNERGYGLVSLYHTLIPKLQNNDSQAKILSQHITNLPVHQAVPEDKIKDMMRELDLVVRKIQY